MSNRNELSVQAQALIEQLSETSGAPLDLDAIRAWLDQAVEYIAEAESLREEHTLLREDYESRIRGMLKAMAVATTQPRDLALSVQEAETLGSLAAPKLIDCYRQVSARFRDTFRGSFAMGTRSTSKSLARAVAETK